MHNVLTLLPHSFRPEAQILQYGWCSTALLLPCPPTPIPYALLPSISHSIPNCRFRQETKGNIIRLCFATNTPQKKEETKQKKHLRRLISEPHIPSPPHKFPRALLLDTFKPPTAKETQFPQTKVYIFVSQSKQTSWKKKNNNNKKKEKKQTTPPKTQTNKDAIKTLMANTKLCTRGRRWRRQVEVVEENQWTAHAHTHRLQREKRACAAGIATPTAFLSPLSSLSLSVSPLLSLSLSLFLFSETMSVVSSSNSSTSSMQFHPLVFHERTDYSSNNWMISISPSIQRHPFVFHPFHLLRPSTTGLLPTVPPIPRNRRLFESQRLFSSPQTTLLTKIHHHHHRFPFIFANSIHRYRRFPFIILANSIHHHHRRFAFH
jgi:hypothetical protein